MDVALTYIWILIALHKIDAAIGHAFVDGNAIGSSGREHRLIYSGQNIGKFDAVDRFAVALDIAASGK